MPAAVTAVQDRGRRAWRRWLALPRAERRLLIAALVVAYFVVALYVLTTRDHTLSGDEVFYDQSARFWAEGKLWWGSVPFGDPHPTAWKAPAYPAFVGTLYAIFGDSPLRVEMIQGLLSPLTVLLTWLAGRRLFGPSVAIVAAWIVAIFPLAFEYYGLLFPEALAVPLTSLVFLLFLGREPTTKRVATVGAVIGLLVLVRPTSAFMLAGVIAAAIVVHGGRRGLRLGMIAIGTAVLVVVPWTVRNAIEHDGFIPVSVQDAAAYGTFNPTTAADTEHRWAWRAFVEPQPKELVPPLAGTQTEAELRSGLQAYALDYIGEHPLSVPKAFFWNGIVRLWDLRRPGDALGEVEFQGRSKLVRGVGLGLYYLLLPLALLGLWRLRSRRQLSIPIAAVIVVMSLMFTVIAGTRYRAPLEPLIVILAASTLPAPMRALDRAEAEAG